jgi:hypothetical protein
MSYEILFSIAHITKRKIILPPNVWLLFISESQDKKNYNNIWEIFNKDLILQEFDCIDFKDVPEFSGKIDSIQSKKSYTENIDKYISDVNSVTFGKKNTILNETNFVLVNGIQNSKDYDDFSFGRTQFDLQCDNKFLHFENNLFGHYWYEIYPGDFLERNLLKRKINRVFRYSDRFYYLAQKVKEKLGPYNSIHVRRNDFLQTRTDDIQCVNNPNKLLSMVELMVEDNIPIYISTDENDKSFFDALKNKYDIYFYDDFGYELNSLDHVVIEQVICSQSEHFYGTYLSTYSKRINVMRGCERRQAWDHKGINYFPPDEELNYRLSDPFPWHSMLDKKWNWNLSSHPQWMIEHNNELIHG